MREPTANSVSVLNPGAASPASHTVKALHRDLKLAVEYVPIESLKTYKRAPRTHSPAHIEQLEDSIRAFGFVQPIMVDADGEIVGGHGMFEATHKAGYRSVPVVRLTHLDEAQKHTLRIALNPLAEKSGWNQELLAREFKELLELDLTLNLDFDLGNIVKREWLCSWAERPSSFDMVVYLLDLVRGRFEVPELRRDVLRLSQAWKADQTIIEDTDIGWAIMQDLRLRDTARATEKPSLPDRLQTTCWIRRERTLTTSSQKGQISGRNEDLTLAPRSG